MMGGEDSLAGLINVELGFVLMGEPNASGSVVPEFNAYVGLGNKGKSLAEMANSFLTKGTMKTEITSKGISCYSSDLYGPKNGERIILPKGCEGFGKKSMTGFVNFEGMDLSSFELNGAAKVLNIIKYITFEVDENGGKLLIKAKKGKENILKQSMEFFVKEFESQITGLPF
jgi:hypothetical protein